MSGSASFQGVKKSLAEDLVIIRECCSHSFAELRILERPRPCAVWKIARTNRAATAWR